MKDLVNIILVTFLISSLSSDEAMLFSANISDFQVNENSVFSRALQKTPFISADSSGNFIIVWEDERNGDYYWDIYAQRFSSDGTAIGSNFKVNDDQGSAYQIDPSISADAGGNFVIAWADRRNGNYDIYAQRYSNDGTALGSNFKVNDNQGSDWQTDPSISTDGSGNFVITWYDGLNDDRDIYAQRYSSDGTALGINFKVNDDQDSADQSDPSISVDDSGKFIITFTDNRNGEIPDIYAQQYSSGGTAQGSNFKVNDDQGWKIPGISDTHSG